MDTSKILVTGGAGFIRANQVDELRAGAHEVLPIDLANLESEQYYRADVKNFPADLKSTMGPMKIGII
jgi:nucleoside-diphosphate-sugar epimerase